jgi:hypothetical protein
MKCIYCKQEIRRPSREHIIPYALGGRYTNKKIVCKDCNGRLGHDVDDILIGWTPFVMTRSLLHLEGHGGDIPRFEIEDKEGRVYITEPGWRLRPKDKLTRIVDTVNDQKVIRQISTTVADEAEGWKDLQRNKKSFMRKLRKQGHRIRETDIKTRRVDMQPQTIRPFGFKHQAGDFGDKDEHYRAIAKIAFNYLATKLAPEEILAPEFDVIREFIRYGNLKSDDHRKLFLADYRDIYTVCSSQAQVPFFHRVTVYCNRATSNVIGLVELFGRVRIAVVLSWQYEGITRGHCLIEYLQGKRQPEDRKLEHFEPILTQMITKISEEELAKGKQDFQKNVHLLATELEDYHTRLHISEVLNDFPELLQLGELRTLIPKLVSYYTSRSNYAALKRLIEKDADHLLDVIVSLQAEKTRVPNFARSEYIELIRKTACIQMLIECLTARIQAINNQQCLGRLGSQDNQQTPALPS